jgi:hypothetical protein
MALAPGASRRTVIGSSSRVQSPLYLSFMLGISLGLLDDLGEVPSTMPPRLP